MELRWQAQNGLPLRKAVIQKLERMLGPLQASGAAVARAVARVVKEHFKAKYPHSKHFSPRKVTSSGDGSNALVKINVPGIRRAYNDIDIYPKNAEWLTIPVHPDARGRSASQFTNLFRPKGHNILAANENGSLVVYYVLSKHVHQKQDRTLMPTEKEMLAAAVKAAQSTLKQ